MENLSPAQTRSNRSSANTASVMRAAHLLLDGEPKILNDYLAGPLCGLKDDAAVLAEVKKHADELGTVFSPEDVAAYQRRSRALVTSRARIAEDKLDEAIARGVTQFVILGAGFDTVAIRRNDLADKVRIFEIDHPVHQAEKRARLAECGVAEPASVTYLPVDFEKDALLSVLAGAGFRNDLPAFVSWIAVTMFLTEHAMFQTLRDITSLAPGTEIVFDHLSSAPRPEDRRHLDILKSRKQKGDAAVSSAYDPVELMGRLRELGFSTVESLNAEMHARYFTGRTDGLTGPGLEHFISARV